MTPVKVVGVRCRAHVDTQFSAQRRSVTPEGQVGEAASRWTKAAAGVSAEVALKEKRGSVLG